VGAFVGVGVSYFWRGFFFSLLFGDGVFAAATECRRPRMPLLCRALQGGVSH